MWLVELVLLSVVLGIPLGIGMRMFDEWRERAKAEAAKPATEATTSEQK